MKPIPKNLPPKISIGFKGFVIRISIVPLTFSCEKLLILSAGIKRHKRIGFIKKKGLKSPKLKFNTLYGLSKNQSSKAFIDK